MNVNIIAMHIQHNSLHIYEGSAVIWHTSGQLATKAAHTNVRECIPCRTMRNFLVRGLQLRVVWYVCGCVGVKACVCWYLVVCDDSGTTGRAHTEDDIMSQVV